jgi:hypothetical protein
VQPIRNLFVDSTTNAVSRAGLQPILRSLFLLRGTRKDPPRVKSRNDNLQRGTADFSGRPQLKLSCKCGSYYHTDNLDSWHNIANTRKKGEGKAHTCANAFHEKAGRSQVSSFTFSLDTIISGTAAQLALVH